MQRFAHVHGLPSSSLAGPCRTLRRARSRRATPRLQQASRWGVRGSRRVTQSSTGVGRCRGCVGRFYAWMIPCLGVACDGAFSLRARPCRRVRSCCGCARSYSVASTSSSGNTMKVRGKVCFFRSAYAVCHRADMPLSRTIDPGT
jgi:hypothetical protein